MIGELSKKQIEQLLSQQIIGRIACCRDGFVYLIPISYAYEDDCIYARGFNGLKFDIMRHNPNVCFETDDATDMANWRSVIAWGKFEELKNSDRKKGLKILLHRHVPLSSSSLTHLGEEWPFSEQELDKIVGVVFRINITKKTGKFESTSVTDPTLGE